jgi:hypothetical protein
LRFEGDETDVISRLDELEAGTGATGMSTARRQIGGGVPDWFGWAAAGHNKPPPIIPRPRRFDYRPAGPKSPGVMAATLIRDRD